MRNSGPKGPGTVKCFLFGWVAAWVAAIYLSCALIWLGGLARVVSGASGVGAIFAIADAISPWAKLAVGMALGALLLTRRKLLPQRGTAALLADCLAAAAAMAIVLALLPTPWCAGFGIGLTGQRFAPLASALYIGAAMLGAVLVVPLEASCRRNRHTLNAIYRDRER